MEVQMTLIIKREQKEGFKVLAVGNGTIGEECALSIMLMNENNVAVDLSITEDGAYLSDFYALTEDMIPRTYDVIDENTYFMQTPVMNGSNPVKDNSMTQQRVWNSMCRAFVKCVAIHTGLGFDLWLKEENHNEPFIPETLKKRASAAKIKTIKQICTSHGVDGDAWVAGNGKTWEELTEEEAAMMLNALKQKYGDE